MHKHTLYIKTLGKLGLGNMIRKKNEKKEYYFVIFLYSSFWILNISGFNLSVISNLKFWPKIKEPMTFCLNF